MARQKVFLIRAELGRTGALKECVMRLPVDRYNGITHKGMQMVRDRFFDGTTQMQGSLRYAVCLEAYSDGHSIAEAIKNYYANKI